MFNNLIIKVMKKIFILAAVTATALTACTKTETTAVSEGNLIKFDNAFVGNVTKADLSNTALKTFWVFGEYDNSGTAVDVYVNTSVTGGTADGSSTWTPSLEAFWIEGKNYDFAAYSNGNTIISNNVTFENDVLTFTDYTVGEHDLIAATAEATGPTAGSDQAVSLSFEHLLSKVKFTFKTNMADTYTMKVEDLVIGNAVKTATVSFSGNEISTDWNGTADATYEFADIADFAVADGGTSELYVIPQNNTGLVASFKVTVTDNSGVDLGSKTFSDVSVAYSGSKNSSVADEWTEGFAYNYTATIDLDDISDKAKPITFTVTEVPGWTDADDTTLNIE
jgi:hypothetical protein